MAAQGKQKVDINNFFVNVVITLIVTAVSLLVVFLVTVLVTVLKDIVVYGSKQILRYFEKEPIQGR